MSIYSSTKNTSLRSSPGKPKYAAIKQTQRKIFACASSITYLHGGRQHGGLGLVMTPSAYDLVAPAPPYILPVHPGDPPTYDGTTQRKIHTNEGQYIARVSDFKNIN